MSLPLFFALYCLEAGLFFAVVPWTSIWTGNAILHSNAWMGMYADNNFVRGFISGIGVLHLILGVRELGRVIRARKGSSVS
ncbi:MAG TPA: hypothetical protein VND45_03865 [Thermoanaerobaculia bacterium]|jgi:hypothetical protein|nr:hypothetical protein [Thermoanaerobaculia bacterium]